MFLSFFLKISGCQSNWEGHTHTARATCRREWPCKGGAEGHGGPEGRHWLHGDAPGAARAVGRAGCPSPPNGWLHEAHILGALLGRHGAHLLLRDVDVLHGRLRLLPPDQEGAVVRGLLPEPFCGEAEASDASPGFWCPPVQRARASLWPPGATSSEPLRVLAGEPPLPFLLPLSLMCCWIFYAIWCGCCCFMYRCGMWMQSILIDEIRFRF